MITLFQSLVPICGLKGYRTANDRDPVICWPLWDSSFSQILNALGVLPAATAALGDLGHL